MLAVALPPSLPLHVVLRTPDIYIVPRTAARRSPRHHRRYRREAGFDKTVHPADIARLRGRAADLLPALAEAPELETWAGLRPTTGDRLPPARSAVPGHQNQFLATGHYRNGILLAPATARVMAELITGERLSVDLSRVLSAAARRIRSNSPRTTAADIRPSIVTIVSPLRYNQMYFSSVWRSSHYVHRRRTKGTGRHRRHQLVDLLDRRRRGGPLLPRHRHSRARPALHF